MKIKLSSLVALPFLVWTLAVQPSTVSQVVNSNNACVGCVKCLEHAPNPLCNCQKICALAKKNGECGVAIKQCPE